MFKVNLTELTKILDVSQYSLYPKMKIKKDRKGCYIIDLDKFLIDQKINDFKFTYELNDSSFSDRLKTKQFNMGDYKDKYITAKEVKKILNINDYKLYLLRKSQKISAIKINTTRYKYNLLSINDYIKDNNLDVKIYLYEYSKQFYSPNELIAILKKDYNIIISLKTIYRYIYEYQKIPCIKVGGNLKIPILEFNLNVLSNVDSIFEIFKK